MSHTQGPWTWRVGAPEQDCGEPVGTIVGDAKRVVCDFGDSTQFYPSEGAPPNDADRALMLAAPDLLAALKAMVASYDGLRDALTCPTVIAKLAAADAALAKAEGQS